MWPIDDSTTVSSPRKEEIVRALVGDSTMTRLLGIWLAVDTNSSRNVNLSIHVVARGYGVDVSKYVALEGVDGSGKSTVATALVDRLNASGKPAILVREPGGTPLGEKVRELLLDSDSLEDWAEVFLFAAQRAELASRVIRPALDAGSWVVADRSYYSSIAYQGRGRGLGEGRVRTINEAGLGGVVPDLVFVLDVDPELAHDRQERPDRIGREGVEFQAEVRAAYLDLAEAEERVHVLDGNRSVDDLVEVMLGVAM
jgi:dTMP kinase